VLRGCDAPVGARRPRPAVELADIVREHGETFRRAHALTPDQHAVLRAIERCRTAVLGGHLDVCLACGRTEPSYNSCRNRHCPKCQSLAQARWIAGRLARILPTHYFHVVFTVPAPLRPVLRRNPRAVFDILFSETLLELGRDPKWLGAELGVTAVLHTWTRELTLHPHVHCIVTGGGMTADGTEWRSCKPNFLLPVRVMGALFRGKMCAKLRDAHDRGKLDLGPEPVDPKAMGILLDRLQRQDWVVYAKRPFGGAEHVVRYLGRYTHRIGISNQRLVSLQDGKVTFRTKNGKAITLDAQDFLARFLQHVLPPGFVKIRHYGLVAPSNATTKLVVARALLSSSRPGRPAEVSPPAVDAALPWQELLHKLTRIDVRRCLACGALAVERRALHAPPARARAPPRAAA
jgi:Putative transposase/Transposase zinc-binding domain